MKYEISIDEQSLELDISRKNDQIHLTSELGVSVLDIVELQEGVYSVLMNHYSFVVAVDPGLDDRIVVNGTPFHISLLDAVHLHLRDLGWESSADSHTGQVITQIPGLITKIFHADSTSPNINRTNCSFINVYVNRCKVSNLRIITAFVNLRCFWRLRGCLTHIISHFFVIFSPCIII